MPIFDAHGDAMKLKGWRWLTSLQIETVGVRKVRGGIAVAVGVPYLSKSASLALDGNVVVVVAVVVAIQGN